MSFANLKKSSKGNFQSLTKKLEDEKKGNYGDDPRYWKFEVDKAGNGYAVIRFLPAVDGEEFPFVKIYKHSFKDKRTNKWYIENSRTTLGEDDPVSEANSELWNTGIESNKEIARQRKRQLKYIANILVVSNPKKPEDEGKVFLWEFGPRIFQKIEGAMKPEFEDEVAFNPFDFWAGANFKLKARMLDNQRSYDKSEFEAPSALFDGDDSALEKLWASQHKLLPEIAPDKFKPYDQLKARFNAVVGNAAVNSNQAAAEREEAEPSVPDSKPAASSKPAAQKPKPVEPAGDDDDMAAYAKLLED